MSTLFQSLDYRRFITVDCDENKKPSCR